MADEMIPSAEVQPTQHSAEQVQSQPHTPARQLLGQETPQDDEPCRPEVEPISSSQEGDAQTAPESLPSQPLPKIKLLKKGKLVEVEFSAEALAQQEGQLEESRTKPVVQGQDLFAGIQDEESAAQTPKKIKPVDSDTSRLVKQVGGHR